MSKQLKSELSVSSATLKSTLTTDSTPLGTAQLLLSLSNQEKEQIQKIPNWHEKVREMLALLVELEQAKSDADQKENFHEHTLENVQLILNSNLEIATSDKLNKTLRLLSKYRTQVLEQLVIEQYGLTIQKGPFQGMKFVHSTAEGCYLPKLLGSYEAELHPYIKAAAERHYDIVANIGAADGYYAVGFALMMPSSQILAYEINSDAQEACRNLAELNGVHERVKIAGEFKGTDFQSLTADGQKAMVFCDIEGGELELLNPQRFDGLERLDFMVECHDLLDSSITTTLQERFADSHQIIRVDHNQWLVDQPDLLGQFSNLDRLLALWEWRHGPTPWLVMLAHQD